MADTDSISKKLQRLAEQHEVLTARQLVDVGISEQAISRLVKSGELNRVRRGIYQHPSSAISEHHDLIQVVKSAPRAVVVLISALKFHNIGTQQAYEVWIQIPAQSRAPKIDWPPVRIIRTRVKELLTAGVEVHHLSGLDVPITTPARTVVDCFKHRNKLGIDVCVEALRETLSARKATIAEISQLASIARVSKTMNPYLESMI